MGQSSKHSDTQSAQPTAAALHKHSWKFWGDDPYLICECGEIRDALNGTVIKKGTK